MKKYCLIYFVLLTLKNCLKFFDVLFLLKHGSIYVYIFGHEIGYTT